MPLGVCYIFFTVLLWGILGIGERRSRCKLLTTKTRGAVKQPPLPAMTTLHLQQRSQRLKYMPSSRVVFNIVWTSNVIVHVVHVQLPSHPLSFPDFIFHLFLALCHMQCHNCQCTKHFTYTFNVLLRSKYISQKFHPFAYTYGFSFLGEIRQSFYYNFHVKTFNINIMP